MIRLFLLLCLIFLWPQLKGQDPVDRLDVLHYHHQLSLSEDNDSIRGVSQITFQTIEREIALNLKGRDTSGTGMEVLSVTDWIGDPLKFNFQNDTLRIFLKEIASESQVRIAYQGKPADGLIISENKFGDRTWFGDNWPNRAQNWIPVVDHPREKATVDFTVQAPKKYSVVANGTLVGLEKSKEFSIWRYSCRHEIPSKVMVIGVANFSVKNYSDTSIAPVSAWVYPQNDQNGFYDYALAPTILSFYDSLFADYPYDKLANVQSTTRYGGMENASCIFYSENSIDGHRSSEALIAHEIVHQWFGNTATECDWPHIWLSEGFATYFTEVFFEMNYGPERFYERWEDVRKRVLKFYKAKPDGKIIDSYNNLNWHLSPLTYQRAAMVLHMLRMYIGEEAFFEGIRTYYAEYRFKNACTNDFIREIQKHSDYDIQAFLEPWLNQPDIPNVQIKVKLKNEELLLKFKGMENVRQQLVLPVYVSFESGEREKRVIRLQPSQKKLKVTFDSSLKKARIDPYGESLVFIHK